MWTASIVKFLTIVFSITLLSIANFFKKITSEEWWKTYLAYLGIATICMISGIGFFILFIIALAVGPLWVSLNTTGDSLKDIWNISVLLESIGLATGLMSLIFSTPIWLISYKILKNRENHSIRSIRSNQTEVLLSNIVNADTE